MKSIHVAVAALTLVAGAARADEVAGESRASANQTLLEPRVGWYVPTGKLGTSPSLSVQAGIPWDTLRQLWLVAELGYAQPSMSNAVAGAAPGTGFNYHLIAHDVGLFLGGRKMFAAPFERKLPRLRPYAEAGLKIHLLYTSVTGSDQSFGSLGRNHESTVVFGLAARGGALYELGPGAVSLTLELGYARLNQESTGGINLFNLTPALGYVWTF